MPKDGLKLRSLKISDEIWATWQAEAKALNTSVTALIIQRMKPPDAAPKRRAKQPKPNPDLIRRAEQLVRDILPNQEMDPDTITAVAGKVAKAVPVSAVVPPNLLGQAVNPRLKGLWNPPGKGKP